MCIQYVVSEYECQQHQILILQTYWLWFLKFGQLLFADLSCFQGLLFCPEAASLMLHNFCIYHIDAPGHEVGVAILPSIIV